MVRVHVPEPEFPPGKSLLWDEILQSHFAIVQQYHTNQRNAERPNSRHYPACLIFGGQAQVQPARPSRGHGKYRQRDVVQLGENFFLYIAPAMRIREQQCAGNSDEDRKSQTGSARSDAARLHRTGTVARARLSL